MSKENDFVIFCFSVCLKIVTIKSSQARSKHVSMVPEVQLYSVGVCHI